VGLEEEIEEREKREEIEELRELIRLESSAQNMAKKLHEKLRQSIQNRDEAKKIKTKNIIKVVFIKGPYNSSSLVFFSRKREQAILDFKEKFIRLCVKLGDRPEYVFACNRVLKSSDSRLIKQIILACVKSEIEKECEFAKQVILRKNQPSLSIELKKEIFRRYAVSDNEKVNTFLSDIFKKYKEILPPEVAGILSVCYGEYGEIKDYLLSKGTIILKEDFDDYYNEKPNLIRLLLCNKIITPEQKKQLVILLRLQFIHVYLEKRQEELGSNLAGHIGYFGKKRFDFRAGDFQQLLLTIKNNTGIICEQLISSHIYKYKIPRGISNRYRDLRNELLKPVYLTYFNDSDEKYITKCAIDDTSIRGGFELYRECLTKVTFPGTLNADLLPSPPPAPTGRSATP
jgi:hypothetical protein